MKTQRVTPKWLAEKMVFIGSQIRRKTLSPPEFILEPSAGDGFLADCLMESNSLVGRSDIWCVELNKEKSKICESKGYRSFHADFLLHDFKGQKFDLIIAAPPFINNDDLLHIQKMHSLLSEDGVLVSLTSPYWLTNNEIHQIEFRKFLAEINYQHLEMVPDNTFMEKGRNVPTAILTISKFNPIL